MWSYSINIKMIKVIFSQNVLNHLKFTLAIFTGSVTYYISNDLFYSWHFLLVMKWNVGQFYIWICTFIYTCTSHKRLSILMWKWLLVEHWTLVCEILAPLWSTGRGRGHTARLSRAIPINCFQAAQTLCFYWDQNIFQVLRAVFSSAMCGPCFSIGSASSSL